MGWTEPYYQSFKDSYEANGGEILVRVMDNEALEIAVSDAIALHGEQKVGVVSLVWVPGFAIQMMKDYDGLSSVYWFGLGDQGRDQEIIEEVGGFQTQLRLFSPMSSAMASARWKVFSEKYLDALGYYPNYYSGTAYDAAWCIALTILETGSTDASIVKEMLPMGSSTYSGVTGSCELDGAGDRAPGIYDIWGYAEVNGEHTFIKYGEYNAYSEMTTWGYLALIEQGITN
jgi:ABC-type branched-subunit amino acid transport system substrate-binding protein